MACNSQGHLHASPSVHQSAVNTSPRDSTGPMAQPSYSPRGARSWAVCWEVALRTRLQSKNVTERRALPGDDTCPCPEPQAPACSYKEPRWDGASARLLVAISAHITDQVSFLLLRRSICSVFSLHPGASVLVVDQASPRPFSLHVQRLGGAGAAISVCRYPRASAWAFGAFEQAYKWLMAHGATHLAYLQHTMALRRPLPLGNLSTALHSRPGCAFVSYQTFRGQNYDSEERMKHFVLKSWVDREWNGRLHQTTPKKFYGVYSHGFVAARSAMETLERIGLFRVHVCSKFQDEGTERMLGLAAEGPLSSPQILCNLDGSLFHAAGQRTDGLHVDKVSHLRPSNNVFKAGNSTLTYGQLNRSALAESIATRCPALAVSGASLEPATEEIPSR